MISRTANPFPPPAPGASRLRRAVQFAMPYRQEVIVICVLTLIAAAVNAMEPLVLKSIFDALTTDAKLRPLLANVGILLALSVGRETDVALCNWLTWRARLGIHYTLLESTVGRLHRMPLNVQRSEGVGAILTRLDRGIQGFVAAVTQLVFNVFPAILYLILSVVIMLRLEWHMALLVVLFAPLPVLISARAAPEQASRERSLLDRWSKIYSRFNEVLSGIVTVRSFTMEDMEKQRFLRAVNDANQVVIKGVGLDSGYGAASNMVVALARVAVIVLGGVFIIKGQTTLGTLIALLGYVGGLFGPVQGLTGVYQTVQRASSSLDEIFGILDVQEHLGDTPNAIELTRVRGDIVFSGVAFSYERASRPLLDGVSLNVAAGETVAIVGPSGSGKTTMMALLMRFYDPLVGSISIDGHDLRELKQSSVRKNIGVVLQDPLLFNDTIRNNIAYGRPDAEMSEVIAAAKAANAHDFITRMPDGYETIVGERGARLSVGERQRLTIARALIKNPRIIVLDEATSSLDAESEGLVQDALEQLMRERTTFVIAHRLSTVVNADRIVVLKDGRIAEIGNHRELVRNGGYYSALVNRQTRGLIVNEGEDI